IKISIPQVMPLFLLAHSQMWDASRQLVGYSVEASLVAEVFTTKLHPHILNKSLCSYKLLNPLTDLLKQLFFKTTRPIISTRIIFVNWEKQNMSYREKYMF